MWICGQIGAREHYAVARALHHTGRLKALYTDFWAGPALRYAQTFANGKFNSRALRSLAGRFHQDLAGATIASWNVRSLAWHRISAAGNSYPGFIRVGQRFAIRVRKALQGQTQLNSNSIFFGYDTGALEALEICRDRGIKRVLNQMDPNRVEVTLVQAEERQWPNWALEKLQVPEEYFRRREREWALADRVVVNSEFSRQALLQQGVSPEKIVVIPLCYEAPPGSRSRSYFSPKPSTAPLRVLFLGQVILRKGIQYLLAAARSLEKDNVRFDIVGPIGITAAAMDSAPRNVTFHGRATRDQATQWYQQSDLFVLPTLSDGFALTQLEAMAHGLPVITTPCCGAVVTEGVDGFVVPARDAIALVQVFQRYLADPELLRNQSLSALEKSRQFTLDRLTTNLLKLEGSILNR